VRRFWKFGEGGELRSRLEGRRQSARPEFVNQLARELRSTGRRRFVPSRLLLAAALSLMMLVAVASVGGVAAGAGIRDQLVAAAKSVNKQVTAKRGSSYQYADDDDDRGGGGGGDDDDDDGGDDDDDGDDDQYEEERRECQRALYQQHRSLHRGQLTRAAHRGAHQLLESASERCSEIGR
jgi:hypothetical protein